MAEINGTNGGETLTGTEGPDTIRGFGGRDRLFGLGGHDSLNGGTGADHMHGGAGDDIYVVDHSQDRVIEDGSSSSDRIVSSVSYSLPQYVRDLTLLGAADLDGRGNGRGNLIIGNSGANVLDGEGGADVIEGGAGDDTIIGGDHGDRLDGGIGADDMTGGAGNDSYFIDNSGDDVTEQPGEGTDTVLSSISHVLRVNFENLTLIGNGAITGTGNGLANRIIGNSANNVLLGEDGDDVLDGGASADVMNGGRGDDTYFVDMGGDEAAEGAAGDGLDTVISSVSFRLGSGIENLTLTGTGDLIGTGNALGNEIVGNAGANFLNGGSGADVIRGGLGDDTYLVDRSDDQVIETSLAAGGTDLVRSAATFTLGAFVEHLVLLGDEEIGGNGNGLNNSILGNLAGNVLRGFDGDDAIRGGGGDDDLDGGEGHDLLNGGADNDTLAGADGRDTLEGSTGNDILNGGDGGDFLYGGNGDDELDGGLRLDRLYGGAGDDRLQGGHGPDLLFGGDGDDEIHAGDTPNDSAGNELYGGLGNDTLISGPGKSEFYFDTPLNEATNVDTIQNFDLEADEETFIADHIYLSDDIFTEVESVNEDTFRVGAAAEDADDRIIYDQITGRLFYDSDGAGGDAQVLFAILTPGLALTPEYFSVY